MNQFIARLVHNFINEVVVEGLAKSRTFQRFAVTTDATLKNVHKASTEKLKTAFEEFSTTANASTAQQAMNNTPPIKPQTGFPGFISAFMKEVRKDMGVGR